MTHLESPDTEQNHNICDITVASSFLTQDNKPWTCDVCETSFTVKASLKRHALIHTRENPYTCGICGKAFSCLADLTRHISIPGTEQTHNNCYVPVESYFLTQDKSTMTKSWNCDESFSQSGHMERQMIMHAGQKLWPCDVCEKSFTVKASLKRHALRRHALIHTRGIRGKSFSCLADLTRHISTPGTERNHKNCDVPVESSVLTEDKSTMTDCDESFSQSGHMERQMIMQTVWTCDVCERSFTVKASLKRHELIHTGEKPYTCGVCGKSFPISGELKRHIWIHSTRQKTWKCDVCEKSFYGEGILKRHTLTHTTMHTGENPWKCDVCAKLFSRAEHLKRHTLTHTTMPKLHTGENPWKCDVCEKLFSREENLKRHTLTHTTMPTGEKTWKCDLCGKSLARAGNLKTHMLIHTGEKPWKCDICGKSCSVLSNLKSHMLIHCDTQNSESKLVCKSETNTKLVCKSETNTKLVCKSETSTV